MRLLRRLILTLSLVLTVAFATLWFRGHSTADSLSLHRASIQRDPAVSEGSMGAWSIHAVQHNATSAGGALSLTRSEYESLNTREPTPAEADALVGGEGWHCQSTSVPVPSTFHSVDATFFHSITDWRLQGFGIFPWAGGASMHQTIEAPLWFLTLVSSTPLLLAVRSSLKRRRRRRRGQCIHCGYDITGASFVCPECGKDL